MLKIILLVALSVASTAWAYSGGAPEGTCDDMTPKHPVDPQKSKFPYKISISKDEIKGGEKVDITIGGSKSFKGFLLQVRNANKKAVGQFVIPDNSKFARTMSCHGNKGSAATHKNSVDKKNFKVTWKAPDAAGKYTVYVTVAQDGGVFWVRNPTEIITVL